MIAAAHLNLYIILLKNHLTINLWPCWCYVTINFSTTADTGDRLRAEAEKTSPQAQAAGRKKMLRKRRPHGTGPDRSPSLKRSVEQKLQSSAVPHSTVTGGFNITPLVLVPRSSNTPSPPPAPLFIRIHPPTSMGPRVLNVQWNRSYKAVLSLILLSLVGLLHPPIVLVFIMKHPPPL